MQKEILSSVFYKVFNRNIDKNDINHRIMMQKVAYLMNEAGTACGDYRFIWYTYGPYSCRIDGLVMDMNEDIERMTALEFDERTEKNIEKLKEVFKNRDTRYSEREWVEALGSLHYLKEYEFPRLDRQGIIRKLASRKKHLSKIAANEKAYDSLASLDL